MTRFRRWPFVWLLGSLLLLLVLVPADRGVLGSRLLSGGLLTIVYLATLAVVFTTSRLRWAAVATGTPALAGAWATLVFPDLPHVFLAVPFHGVSILFLTFTTVVILRTIFRFPTVTTDAVAGALWQRADVLRYGENPHQRAALYVRPGLTDGIAAA